MMILPAPSVGHFQAVSKLSKQWGNFSGWLEPIISAQLWCWIKRITFLGLASCVWHLSRPEYRPFKEFKEWNPVLGIHWTSPPLPIDYTFYQWQPSHLVGPLNAPSNCFGQTTLLRQTDIFKPSWQTGCDDMWHFTGELLVWICFGTVR